ncbi:cardiolipin synthase [Desulfopila aestuarii]|uniref:Cardiolipin synthase n=1 Tax=Desulfopila aestuarii DSM 18488 TaxID=1121416 RepID=A0A1M7Y4F6_9BACT|nr:cardiolipin synthase [Desulfopila aestuarii]SHO47022.1 cardiolipin synthase [Desulfopila aestuarii DSM 18488]
MLESLSLGTIFGTIHILVQLVFCARALLRPHREPASRIAWIVVIMVFPVVGIITYLLLGETNVGRHRIERMQIILSRLPNPATAGSKDSTYQQQIEDHNYQHLFEAGRSVNGFLPVNGNRARLLGDSNATIDAMVADIDAAIEQVHLMFYIWLPDNNGRKIAEALQRAASRGVICRAMADSLGSRSMINSPHWHAMSNNGVRLACALPIAAPPFGLLKGRIDLRNHRKIVIIDNRITYCGSQNCADPEFLIKAKYGPWVDVMVRFEGPIALQNQYLFASDWMHERDEDITCLLTEQPPHFDDGITAQVIGTGPTVRYSAMPEIFESLMYAARKELVISTPYYVPDESMQAALCACARRGIATTLIVPALNDSWIVGAASKSYYSQLLNAGVQLFEYEGGLLHAKTLTLDGEVTLIGSANMDRRSFELNYENNILVHNSGLTADVRGRQQQYIDGSHQVTKEMVKTWSWQHNLINNAVATIGPIL